MFARPIGSGLDRAGPFPALGRFLPRSIPPADGLFVTFGSDVRHCKKIRPPASTAHHTPHTHHTPLPFQTPPSLPPSLHFDNITKQQSTQYIIINDSTVQQSNIRTPSTIPCEYSITHHPSYRHFISQPWNQHSTVLHRRIAAPSCPPCAHYAFHRPPTCHPTTKEPIRLSLSELGNLPRPFNIVNLSIGLLTHVAVCRTNCVEVPAMCAMRGNAKRSLQMTRSMSFLVYNTTIRTHRRHP